MTASRHAPRERSLALIVAFLGLAAAIAFFTAFAANGFDRRAIHWGRVQVFLVWILPLLPGLVMLAVRRLRDAGIAYSAGIGAVAVLALALPLGLAFIFLAVATPEQRVDAVAMYGYMLSMLAVALAGWTSFFRLPADRRPRAVLAVTLIGAACYALFAGWFIEYRMEQPYDRAALIREYNDRQARTTIKSIAECARRQGGSGRGVPAGMAELHAAGCLPGNLERGTSNAAAGADGYAFYYFADPPDASGKALRFAACAVASREEDGTLTIGIGPGGGVNELQSAAGKRTPGCFAAWAGGGDRKYLDAAAACLMSGAALRPGRGYPPTLFNEQGSHAGACDFEMRDATPDGRVRTDRGVLEYRPEPEVAGVVRGYWLALFPAGGGAPIEVDHRGRARTLPLPDVPPSLAAIEAARPAQVLKSAALADRRRELVAACEGGNLAVCEDLGAFEYDNGRPAEGERWWDHACRKGRLQSCLLGARFNPTPDGDPRDARMYKERCKQGDPRACGKLDEMVRDYRPRIEELRREGGRQDSSGAQARIDDKRRELVPLCEAGNAELCENLGDLEWDTRNLPQAVRWWDRACESGRLRACLLGERYNPGQARDPVMALRDQCRQGGAGACKELETIVTRQRSGIDALLAKNRR